MIFLILNDSGSSHRYPLYLLYRITCLVFYRSQPIGYPTRYAIKSITFTHQPSIPIDQQTHLES